MLSNKRDTTAARKFFANAIYNNGIPKRITTDQSKSNAAGIKEVNKIFKRLSKSFKIDTVRSKFLNNIIERDYWFNKSLTRPTFGFKNLTSAAATLTGIEITNVIRKE
ncbi:hypothetical protein RUM8411_02026 [Ruegeria meonggei]|uniref:DDE domain-containing protein n=1 Tax=Ruegeria meonggei TaxID=1446476 RepID=A0A1X6Z8H2_9RHOB|nr:hypothetical protein RUM8411_02026 [Ruegeria meonggei]